MPGFVPFFEQKIQGLSRTHFQFFKDSIQYKKEPIIYVSMKLPVYPFPKPTLTISSYLGQNVGLGEGLVGSFTEK